jgi:hypothetical protein
MRDRGEKKLKKRHQNKISQVVTIFRSTTASVIAAIIKESQLEGEFAKMRGKVTKRDFLKQGGRSD